MESPRGAVCTESSHSIKTIAKAQEWCATATNADLPLTINQHKEPGGRLMVKIYNKDNIMLEKRG